jgi:hypothetical protein
MNYAVTELRRKQINDYMSSIELNEDSISVSQIKMDLQRILGEKPGVELKYKKDDLITEGGVKTRQKGILESISIYYTYEDNDGPHFDRVSYFV